MNMITKSDSSKNGSSLALEAIRKKLIGKSLNYKEIYSIMDDISKNRLGDIATTYFAASGYSKGFSDEELYFLIKAMVETGEKLHFRGIVADKHSIGGVPGTRTTLIVVPIVAAAGFKIPKSSSRSITTPAGTADDMEILCPVNFTKKRIYEIVKQTNGCIVWGGNLNIAPADNAIIKVEKPLLFESYDKVLVSIMAKKIAFGSNHVVIDIPYGKTVKIQFIKDAEILKEKFEKLAKRFNIKLKAIIHKTDQPAGRGIGAILETREAIKVLQQTSNRPLDLEIRSINLAGNLLDLCLGDSDSKLQQYVKENFGNSFGWAQTILKNGQAFLKMKEIIKAQGGNPNIDSNDLQPGKYESFFKAGSSGKVKEINIKNLTSVAKTLGAPDQKGAGIFLNKKIGDEVKVNENLYILYSENMYNLKEGKHSAGKLPIVLIE